MEIAGSTCTVCGRHVVFAQDGKCCPTCGIVVHETCDTQSRCPQCDRAYEAQVRPILDPLRDAIVPRSLRSSTPGAVAMVIFGALLFVFLIFALRMLLGHGH